VDTKVFKIDINEPDINLLGQAADVIKNGGLVAFPTETVYGLGANGFCEDAIKKIFLAKGRPSDNPLILHIAEKKTLNTFTASINEDAEKIINLFWPGPITLVFPKKSIVPDIVTAGLDTVAVRNPKHNIAKLLIQLSGVPIAAPSANISGKPSPTIARHVIDDLYGKVDVIIDGGNSQVGLESTVLDVSSDIPTLLRPGGITYEQLKEVLGNINIAKGVSEKLSECEKAKSPGMKYVHYSPEAEVVIFEGERKKIIDKIDEMIIYAKKEGKKVGIIVFDIDNNFKNADMVVNFKKSDTLDYAASNLFTVLRRFDEENIDSVFVEGLESRGLGLALRNRLDKAAGYNIIRV
jgi:L-threonylcarbamoyladenylate synthase